ncbi:lipid asymmetry maintenance protein MlaB [Chromobacterium sp. IIBBL 290-4]|uniref:STAS domain-containing protein n=1 Tax=Chromobacterium sp. IIBBL 290-4 TaxID=2953890 RepID=UPI0020B6D021|nr:STAS domain-containing protein [Chromobacterium sp. IIBBL 290-4]UTH73253.1 STAS domain-containing protein [Chromobacterium sp. IIBBL 290-4]
MPLTLTQDGDATLAALTGEITIFTAEELQDELLGLLNHEQVKLDLSGITELDGCGAQLLCVALTEARRLERPFQVAASNELVDEVGRWLGFSGHEGAQRDGS